MWGALARSAVKAGAGLLSRAPRVARQGATVLGTAVAVDAVGIPALEAVTGRDVPGGTFTRDAAGAIANSLGNVVGAAQSGGVQGVAEGAARQLLGTSDEDSKTIGLIVVGGFALLLFLSLARGR